MSEDKALRRSTITVKRMREAAKLIRAVAHFSPNGECGPHCEIDMDEEGYLLHVAELLEDGANFRECMGIGRMPRRVSP